MEEIREIRKENTNYLEHNKICNRLDLGLYYFKNYLEQKEGRSEHENYLLYVLEKEVNTLRETLEAYKKELDMNHFEAIENLKNNK